MAEVDECPMYRFCKIVDGKWGCIIVDKLLQTEEMGFNELLRAINTNPRTLSLKLKLLEKNGLVKKRILEQERPIRVMYSLTPKGKEASKVKEFIAKWLKNA